MNLCICNWKRTGILSAKIHLTIFLGSIELKTGENIDEKFNIIKNFINKNNFENAANTFSISDSSKFGGKGLSLLKWFEELIGGN